VCCGRLLLPLLLPLPLLLRLAWVHLRLRLHQPVLLPLRKLPSGYPGVWGNIEAQRNIQQHAISGPEINRAAWQVLACAGFDWFSKTWR
jgi:hypothetical protein